MCYLRSRLNSVPGCLLSNRPPSLLRSHPECLLQSRPRTRPRSRLQIRLQYRLRHRLQSRLQSQHEIPRRSLLQRQHASPQYHQHQNLHQHRRQSLHQHRRQSLHQHRRQSLLLSRFRIRQELGIRPQMDPTAATTDSNLEQSQYPPPMQTPENTPNPTGAPSIEHF
jgi:hypothetical protein